MMSEEGVEQFIKDNYGEFIKVQWDFQTNDKFRLIVKCKPGDFADHSEFSTDFIRKFSSFTNTNWIVRSTFPKLKRLAYRNLFVCQHSSFNKKAENLNRVRARACHAFIDFKAKKVNRNTCRYDADLKEGFTMMIKLEYSHSHLIQVAEAFSYLRSDTETDDCFRQYFESGMTPASALALHEMMLLEKYGKESATYLANAQLNPSENHVYYLYHVWRRNKYGDSEGTNMNEVLEKKFTELREKGYIIVSKKNPKVTVVISPIMKKVFMSEITNDMLFIDSTSSCDQSNTVITFVFTSSKVGALPVACAFHTLQDTANYTLVFSMIKDALDEIDEVKKINPAIIMTDDSKAERNALKTIFPESRLLLCCFHVAQAFWRWLCNGEHRIDIAKRQMIMKCFSKLMFASSEENALELYQQIISDSYVKTCSNLIKHMENLWNRRSEWCTAYRIDVLNRGSNTNNYTEASIRIFKDVILQRCKAFNVCALIDFLANIFEKYQYRRLMKFANCRRTNSLAYLKFSRQSKDMKQITRISEFEFLVEETDNAAYSVDIHVACCDCLRGQGGAFCKHLCAVEIKYGLILKTSPKLSKEDRITCAKIASEVELSDEFYQNMNMLLEKELQPVQDDGSYQIQNTTQAHAPQPSSSSHEDVCTEKYSEYLTQMEAEFHKLINIFKGNPSPSNLKAMCVLNSSLKSIKTDQQAQNFIHNNLKRKLTRKIHVQPTAVARRMSDTRTRNRVQAGRPIKRKRNHDLALNVSLNRHNAR